MEQMHKFTDVFLTHTWKNDEEGRDNHARVSIINEHLSRRGFATWFDSQKMEGKIREKMAEGVDYTNGVIVFVTKQYMKKLDSGDENDNCLYEYKRALSQKTDKKILCVTMEKYADNPSLWEGYLKDTMGESLFVSFSGDLNNTKYVSRQLDDLIQQLELKGIKPSQMRRQCITCTVLDSDNNRHNLGADGKCCPYCGDSMQDVDEPKHYCAACNRHESGPCCGNCGISLVDEDKKIQEMEEQYTYLLKLKTEIDYSKYPSLQEKYRGKLEKWKMELEELKEARNGLQATGAVFVLKDALYNEDLQTLDDDMNTLHEDGSQLPESARMLTTLEPAYHNRVQQLEMNMHKLAEERKKVREVIKNLSRTEGTCHEKMETIEAQLQKLKDIGTEVLTDVAPNHNHERSCSCEVCLYQEELTKELLQSGLKYVIKIIKANKIDTLDLAIQLNGEVLKIRGDNKRTPLHCAVEYGTPEMLRMLLEKGAEVNTKDDGQRTPLICAAEYCQPKMLKMLLEKGAEVNVKDADLRTPLLCAAKHDTPEMTKMLLEKGVEVNAKDADQRTPLLCAAEYGTPEVLRMLLAKGAEVNVKDAKQRTPLLCAAQYGTPDMLKMLLEKGADVNAKDYRQRSSLLFAAELARPEMVTMLLEKGAEVCGKDSKNRTPLMAAYYANDQRCINELEKYVNYPKLEYKEFLKYKAYENDLLEKLDQQGFDFIEQLVKNDDAFAVSALIDVRNDVISMRGGGDDYTPFTCAARFGTVRMLQMLKEQGGDASAVNEWRNGIFHNATYEKANGDVMEWLCTNYHELIDQRNKSWCTPVCYAASKGTVAALKILLKYGASLSVKNAYGRYPYGEAKHYKQNETAQILEKWMRDHNLPFYDE